MIDRQLIVRTRVAVRHGLLTDFSRLIAAPPKAPDRPVKSSFFLDAESGQAVILEVYRDSDHLLAHVTALTGGPSTESVQTYDLIDLEIFGRASPEVRRALADAATFYSPIAAPAPTY